MTEHATGSAGRVPPAADPGGPAGRWLVIGLVSLAVGLGVFAVWFQWGQTRRCLAFFGPRAARHIQSAARVELWTLASDGERVRAVSRQDVSAAPGIVHLRRGLIEDVNYRWDLTSPGASRGDRLPAAAWDQAIVFLAEPDAVGAGAEPSATTWRSGEAATLVAFDLDGDGSATVVGQPGRVALGRLAAGLRTWLKDAGDAGSTAAKPGF